MKFKGSAHPPDFSFQDLMVGHHGDGNGSRSDKDSETGTDIDGSADGSFINDQFCHGPHHQSGRRKGTDCREFRNLFFAGLCPDQLLLFCMDSILNRFDATRPTFHGERKKNKKENFYSN